MGPQSNNNNFFGTRVSQPGINVNQAGPSQLLYQNNYETESFYDSSGNARVLIGALPDSSYGMWVSSPGVNAAKANPFIPGQLVFNSNNQTYNIENTNSTEIPSTVLAGGGDINNITIPHNLGFAPIVQAYALMQVSVNNSAGFVTSYVPLPIVVGPANLFNNVIPMTIFQIYASADAENVYFTYFYFPTSPGTQDAIPIQYYLQSVSTT